jgi:uncharacterized protein
VFLSYFWFLNFKANIYKVFNDNMFMDKNQIINKIEKNKEKLLDLGVKNIELFGSYATNDALDSSDIDFLVEFEENRGLFSDYIGLHNLLKELFKKDIDLVKKNLIKKELEKYILGGTRIAAKL